MFELDEAWEVSYCVEDDQDVQRAAAALQQLKEDLESFVLSKADTTPFKKPPESTEGDDDGGEADVRSNALFTNEATAGHDNVSDTNVSPPNGTRGDAAEQRKCDANSTADADPAAPSQRVAPSPAPLTHGSDSDRLEGRFDSPPQQSTACGLPPATAEDTARSQFITQLLLARRRKVGGEFATTQSAGNTTVLVGSQSGLSTAPVPSPYTHLRYEDEPPLPSVSPTVSCASQPAPHAAPLDDATRHQDATHMRQTTSTGGTRRARDWTEVFFQRGHLSTPRAPHGALPTDRDAVFRDLIRVSDDIARGASLPIHSATTPNSAPLSARSQPQHQPVYGGTDSTAPPSISLSPVPTDGCAQANQLRGGGDVSPGGPTEVDVNLQEVEQDASAPADPAVVGRGVHRTTSPLYHYPEDETPRGGGADDQRNADGVHVGSGNTPAYILSDGTPNASARRSTHASSVDGVPPSQSPRPWLPLHPASPPVTQQRLFAACSPPLSARSPMPATPRMVIGDDGWRPTRKTRVGALTPDTRRATTRTEKTFDGSVVPSSIAAIELIEHVAQQQAGGEVISASSPPAHLSSRILRSASPQTHPIPAHRGASPQQHVGAHPPPHTHPIVLGHGGEQQHASSHGVPSKVPPLPLQRLEVCMASTELPRLHARPPTQTALPPPRTACGDTLSSPPRLQALDPQLVLPRGESWSGARLGSGGEATEIDTPNRAAAAAALRRRSVTFV